MEKKGLSEDWLAVIIGLLVFVLSLGVFIGWDLLGWGIKTNVWINISKALEPFSKAWAGVGGVGALVLTYLFLLIVMTIGSAALGAKPGKFAAAFTVVFAISYACWLAGSYANIAATPD